MIDVAVELLGKAVVGRGDLPETLGLCSHFKALSGTDQRTSERLRAHAHHAHQSAHNLQLVAVGVFDWLVLLIRQRRHRSHVDGLTTTDAGIKDAGIRIMPAARRSHVCLRRTQPKRCAPPHECITRHGPGASVIYM